jgi:hypothetical protein
MRLVAGQAVFVAEGPVLFTARKVRHRMAIDAILLRRKSFATLDLTVCVAGQQQHCHGYNDRHDGQAL